MISRKSTSNITENNLDRRQQRTCNRAGTSDYDYGTYFKEISNKESNVIPQGQKSNKM